MGLTVPDLAAARRFFVEELGYQQRGERPDYPAVFVSDGRLEIDDDTWGWGGNVGVLYEPMPGTRLGLTYTSAIDLGFSGRARTRMARRRA